MNTSNIHTQFTKKFKQEPTHMYWAPGRVNLIGEHIDYNGGNVLPFTINMGTYLAVSLRSDQTIRFFSENFKESGIIEVSLSDIEHANYQEKWHWANFPIGVLKHWAQKNFKFEYGFDAYFIGTLPHGAGLSSSASIEIVTQTFINDVLHAHVDQLTQVKWAQQIENDFIGVPCGIMDQFAIGIGGKDTAISLNCNTLQFNHVPLHLGDYEILIMNTNKSRELTDSAYHIRLEECQKALNIIQNFLPIHTLCDLSLEALPSLKKELPPKLYKRVRHVVSEQLRVLKSIEALKNNDLVTIGQLLNESHNSLQNNYEVTGTELDTIVSIARAQNGVLGARMTGAGFGGCAIALIEHSKIDEAISNISHAYTMTIGYPPSFYIAKSGEKTGRIPFE